MNSRDLVLIKDAIIRVNDIIDSCDGGDMEDDLNEAVRVLQIIIDAHTPRPATIASSN